MHRLSPTVGHKTKNWKEFQLNATDLQKLKDRHANGCDCDNETFGKLIGIAERAVSPAESVQSIDTPEFRLMLSKYNVGEVTEAEFTAHIDAQFAKARDMGYVAGFDDAMEKEAAGQAPDLDKLICWVHNDYGDLCEAANKASAIKCPDEAFVRLSALQALLSSTAQAQHPDDLAVDLFAAATKAKMATSRAKGRGGWDDPARCDVQTLAQMLVDHMSKGDPVDIGIFAMMLWNRKAMPWDIIVAMEGRPFTPSQATPEGGNDDT